MKDLQLTIQNGKIKLEPVKKEKICYDGKIKPIKRKKKNNY